MDLGALVFLVLAGLVAGLVGYLTGLASLVSYPALLAVGLNPVAANITNTLGLVGAGFGSTAKALDRVVSDVPRRQLLQELSLAGVGGLLGAGLLLVGGESVFTVVVPWLIALGSGLLWFSPQLRALQRRRGDGVTQAPVGFRYLLGMFAVCVYSGYFGAGAGVLYMALTAVATTFSFSLSLIMKSTVFGLSNLMAALLFVMLQPIHWSAAAALAVGCLVGGYLGPVVQPWFPETLLRAAISLGGLGLAAWLLL